MKKNNRKWMLLIFIIIVFYVSNYTIYSKDFLTNKQKKVVQEINDLRTSLNFNRFCYDTNLVKVAHSINSGILNIDSMSGKDKLNSVRRILRENNCFDYQVKIIKVKIDTISNINTDYIINNKELNDIVHDSTYNNFGISIIDDCIEIIFTQNYIDLNPEREGLIINNIDSPPTKIVTIKGKTRIPNINYIKYSSTEVDKKHIIDKELLPIKDNSFIIKIDISDNNANIPQSIAIVDSSDKILAFINPL